MQTKPKMKMIWKVLIGIAVAFIGLMIIAVATDDGKGNSAIANTAVPKLNPLFDLPNYIGKDITSLKQIIGNPKNEELPTKDLKRLGYYDASVDFTKNNYTLSVEYNAQTKKVNNFFISDSGTVPNYHVLLQLANVNEEDINYTVKPIEDLEHLGHFTGVKIIPGIRASNVELATQKEKFKKQFNAWDGSNTYLVQYLKDHLNDPKSFEHIKTVYWDQDSIITVRMEYTAKNGFGGRIRGAIKATIDPDGNIIKVLESN